MALRRAILDTNLRNKEYKLTKSKDFEKLNKLWKVSKLINFTECARMNSKYNSGSLKEDWSIIAKLGLYRCRAKSKIKHNVEDKIWFKYC